MRLKFCRSISAVIVSMFLAEWCYAEDVPDVVKESFAKHYPDTKVDKWELDDHGYWEAKFEINDLMFRADFLKDGAWHETERNVELLEVPHAIRKLIAENFPDRELNEIEWVDSAGKGLFYDLEFKQEGPNMDVVCAPDGTILQIENQKD